MKTKLPSGWTLMRNKRTKLFAPRNRDGVTFENIGIGLWHGGTRAQAIAAAWDIERSERRAKRRAKEWVEA